MIVGKKWSPTEEEALVAMRLSGESVAAIAAHLNRTPKAVEYRLYKIGLRQRFANTTGRPARSRPRETVEAPAPSRAFLEREARLALAPRDLTAAFFGDPLPGYSALDRREGRT